MSKELRVGLEMVPQTGTVNELGTVSSMFGDLKQFRFIDKNRVHFQFRDSDTNQQFLVVLSNGLANAYQSGQLTAGMCWNLPVYKVTENQDGEPLTDKKGNVIPHMLVMGSPQTPWQNIKGMKETIKEAIYKPMSSGAFDEYF